MSAHTARVYRRIATAFLLLTAGALVLAAYIVFAHAEVTVLSEPQDVSGDFIVDVAQDPQRGEVKGTVVEMSDTVTEAFPASSVVSVDKPAEGKVRIANSLSRSQTLVATTRLLTASGTLFRIKSTVTIPARGSAVVEAFATQAGEDGKVPTGTTFTIPGLSDALQPMFVTTAEGDFAIPRTEIRSITQTDIDNATDTLKERVLKDLSVRMREKARTDGYPTSGEIVSAGDVSRITDAVTGSDAESFRMTVTVRAVGVYYDADGFLATVKTRLNDRLYDGRVVTGVDASGMETRLEKRDALAGRANIGVSVRGSSILSSASPSLSAEKLVGISEDAARRYLESVEGVASASVKSVPFWIHRMPNVATHIKVEVR